MSFRTTGVASAAGEMAKLKKESRRASRGPGRDPTAPEVNVEVTELQHVRKGKRSGGASSATEPPKSAAYPTLEMDD